MNIWLYNNEFPAGKLFRDVTQNDVEEMLEDGWQDTPVEVDESGDTENDEPKATVKPRRGRKPKATA